MSLGPKLILRQSQSLVMTPQLMQAIKLLQFSSVELAAYVAEELERNPLLERADGSDDHPAATEPPGIGSEETAAPDADLYPGNEAVGSRAEIEDRLDTDFGNVFPDDAPAPTGGDTYSASAWSGAQGGAWDGDGETSFEAFLAHEASLGDHLEAQLLLAISDPRRRLIGLSIVNAIDDSGYLGESVESLADRLGAAPAEVEAVLAVVQGFDPPGIGARSIAECLAIQLREKNRLDPAMAALLDRLDLVARRDYPALRKVCGLSDEDLTEMLAELRALTPKPGLCFGSAHVQTVVPDVLVRRGPAGDWLIELNPETLPRVLVNQTYHARVSTQARNAGEKAFLAEALQNANWLTRSLEQRARTILKVCAEIVRQQDAFLTHGVEYLRPLNLKAVADVIAMHESTVSRVTANKYVATPRGIFELKYFFTAALSSTSGRDTHSAESVRYRIRQMIDGESAGGILSDDVIVKRLREGGIDIARRTVAKYREGMGIGSSVERRRQKMERA